MRQPHKLDLRDRKPGALDVYPHSLSVRSSKRRRLYLLLAALGLVVVLAVPTWLIYSVSTNWHHPTHDAPIEHDVPGMLASGDTDTGTSTVQNNLPSAMQSTTTANDIPAQTPTSSVPTTTPTTPVPVVEPTTPTPSTPSTNLDYSVGIAMGETLTVVSPSELARQLDDIVSLGVGWIRVDLAWSTIQRSGSDAYEWAAFDRIVVAARQRNIQVLPILTYTPSWARSDACRSTSKCPPADPERFAAFARSAVARYSPQGVHTWEIWNEPNLRIFWSSGADAESYVRLLKASYLAIHDVDATATVVSGGLAPVATGGGSIAPRDFLEQMYAHGARDYMDAVGFHPYSFPHSPSYYHKSSAWSQMAETEWSLRSIMQVAGDSHKKIWLTEYGAPTGGPGNIADDNGFTIWTHPDHVTEGYQELMVREAIEETRATSWDGPLFWYSYKDLGTSDHTKENFFGIIRYDGSKKPAYYKMRELLTGA